MDLNDFNFLKVCISNCLSRMVFQSQLRHADTTQGVCKIYIEEKFRAEEAMSSPTT